MHWLWRLWTSGAKTVEVVLLHFLLPLSTLTATSLSDPIFLSIFPDIITSLTGSSQSGIYEAVVKQALPPLCNSIAHATLEESWIASSAIELVGSIVKGAPPTGLGEGFFAMLAPSLFKCLGDAEDRDVLQVNTSLFLFSWRRIVNISPEWSLLPDASG